MVKIKKILKKPKGKRVIGISSEKTLRSFANSSDRLVREVEEKEIVQDNRSQFFKDEFQNEVKGINKWLE